MNPCRDAIRLHLDSGPKSGSELTDDAGVGIGLEIRQEALKTCPFTKWMLSGKSKIEFFESCKPGWMP